MDVRNYPEGRGAQVSRYIKNVLVEFGVFKQLRTRVTRAQLNAGFNLLPALPGVKWQLVNGKFIAVGGAATSGTSVNLKGTQSGSAANLAIITIAALTQSAVVTTESAPAAGSVTLLADGASFIPNDVNTAMSVITVGSAMTVMTNLDCFIGYIATQG